MTTFLDRNLEALARTAPETAEAIQNAPPAECACFVWEQAKKTSVPTLYFQPPDGGQARYLTSRYDPIREADRWVEAHTLERTTNLAFVGIGSGYHLHRYLIAHVGKTRHIIIIERSAALCRAALSATDLSNVLGLDHVLFLLAPDPKNLGTLIANLRTDFVVHNLKVLSHEASTELDRPYYVSLLSELNSISSYDQVNVQTAIRQRGLNQVNILSNLVAFWLGVKPEEVHGMFHGYPGFVVAAGPSLDKNVRELRRVQGRGAIIAVETAQNTLNGVGIEPDFIVTADPTDLNFRHFDKIDSLGRSLLAFHPECNFQIIDKYASHPYLLPLRDESQQLLDYLHPVHRSECIVRRGMMVGQIAMNLAYHLGCEPVVLLGMDLAFSREGGTTHAEGAAVSRVITAPARDGSSSVGAKDGVIGTEEGKVIWVDGIDGQPVPTTTSFETYITDMERIISLHDTKVIDATEGGALIHNTEIARLADVIDGLSCDADVPAMMDRLRQPRIHEDPTRVWEKLREGLQLLREDRQILIESAQRVGRWAEMAHRGEVSSATAQSEWQDMEADWQRVVSDPRFDQMLGQTVMYLYYRRQRSEDMPDDRPETFLRVMGEKYEYILSEMIQNIIQFEKVIEIVIERLEKLCRLIRQHSASG